MLSKRCQFSTHKPHSFNGCSLGCVQIITLKGKIVKETILALKSEKLSNPPLHHHQILQIFQNLNPQNYLPVVKDGDLTHRGTTPTCSSLQRFIVFFVVFLSYTGFNIKCFLVSLL